MNTKPKVTADDLLEIEIQEAYNKALAADNESDKHKYLKLMAERVNMRSPERVKQMELEKGLL